MNVLFLYPNINTELRIPLAISILTSCIRNAGHTVHLFDTTFMVDNFSTDDDKMASLGTHLPTDIKKMVGVPTEVSIEDELVRTVQRNEIDAVLVSLLERNYPTAKRLCKIVKKRFQKIPIIIGGIMPTIATDFLIKEDWVDVMCIGEGEGFVVDILNALEVKRDYSMIRNIAFQKDGKNVKFPLRDLVVLDSVPEQSWDLFDLRHLLKPFMGKVYRGGPFEFSRGCNKFCTFCVAPRLRRIQIEAGKYHRTKSPQKMLLELENKVSQYDLTMVSFGDTDFLASVPTQIMIEFLTGYKERVNLPFTIQCSAETLIKEEVVQLLVDAGCCACSVGVESGSDRIRKEVIKKHVKKEIIKRAFEICWERRLRITGNYMVGVPFETEADVLETMQFNRELKMPSIAVTFFTPFVGTELYDIAIKEGFYKNLDIGSNNYETSPLEMPQFPPEAIHKMVRELVDDFNKYHKDFVPLIIEKRG